LILAGNWKLNKGPTEAKAFAEKFLKMANGSLKAKTIIFPTALSLATLSEVFKDSEASFGLQNMALEPSGAFTGENSGEMSKALGAKYVLIGHSERRALYKESNETVNKKVKAAIGLDLVPMICIGETLADRKEEKTNEVLKTQLKEALLGCSFKVAPVIAYEPVWAIGTGEVATPEQANNAHQFIKNLVKDLLPEEVSVRTAVLYGGSVKPTNAESLSEMDFIDGFLVGGASLKVDSFIGIGEFC